MNRRKFVKKISPIFILPFLPSNLFFGCNESSDVLIVENIINKKLKDTLKDSQINRIGNKYYSFITLEDKKSKFKRFDFENYSIFFNIEQDTIKRICFNVDLKTLDDFKDYLKAEKKILNKTYNNVWGQQETVRIENFILKLNFSSSNNTNQIIVESLDFKSFL
ncbi:hypothetical protein [Empedobacter tilapiae]|uniref:hypothetical protein n=1 Tax=Empedobacter tilapiae TaxID=2491114 RepID=UPI0028D3AF16|nr:hypothetical protein [Empedobacter tilapiae]